MFIVTKGDVLMYRRVIMISVLAWGILGCEKKSEVKVPEVVQSKVSKLTQSPSKTNSTRNKVNIYFITQVGCGACEQIKGHMKKPAMKTILEDDFIVTEVDITKKEDLPFVWMKPFATPTLYFFDEKENEIIDMVVRRLDEKAFSDIIEEVLEVRDMD